MLQNRNVSIDEFIKFTAGGPIIADYDQIQTALINKYKEVYGYDIDLANTTADGIFVNNLALIINNILQSFKTLYSNLNINTASGVYLDNLCRLSNVTRKRATQSTADLLISATQDTTLYNGTIFIDNTGNEWIYNGNDIAIDSSSVEKQQITVTCSTYGPIKAAANSITQTLEATYLVVEQPNAANVGQNDETDSELRARRDQSKGSQGVTVLESLVGALLDITGIDDVQIIANNSDESTPAADGTSINAHAVYIIIRKADNVIIDKSTIGKVIYNCMTPGISTTKFTGSNGTEGEYSEILDPNIDFITQSVYWKNATAINPTITVTVQAVRNYTDNTSNLIEQALLDYFNNLQLSTTPTENDIIINAIYADTSASYSVTNVNITAAQTNKNTYYHYTTADPQQSGNTITFTFS